MNFENLIAFIDTIKQCYDWKTLYTLSYEFNQFGLCIKSTTGGKIILCRTHNNIIITNKIINDYIFIGSINELDSQIPQRALDIIINFVNNNASAPYTNNDSFGKSYNNKIGIYGKPINIANESTLKESQDIIYISKLIID